MLNEETKRELNYIAIRKMIEPAEITYWKQKQKTVRKQLSDFIHSVIERVSSPILTQPTIQGLKNLTSSQLVSEGKYSLNAFGL